MKNGDKKRKTIRIKMSKIIKPEEQMKQLKCKAYEIR